MITIPANAHVVLRESPNAAQLGDYLIENMHAALREAGLLGQTATPAQLLDAIDTAFYAYTSGVSEAQGRIFWAKRSLRCAQYIIDALAVDPADVDAMGTLLSERGLRGSAQ